MKKKASKKSIRHIGGKQGLSVKPKTARERRTVKCVVTVEIKEGELRKRQTMNHIREAVWQWGGQFDTENVFFSTNIKKVTVAPK